MNAVTSIKTQTHTNVEIIIINDHSTEREYYEYDWQSNDIIIIHLEQNTKEMFGFACAGHNRNIGIQAATGKYVGFCDDDDVWFPSKLELQINAMKETKCKMSSTDGLIGQGMYDNAKTYKKYNSEHFLEFMKNKYGCMLQGNSFPKICTPDYFHIHNYIICSSVLIEKELLTNINNFKHFILKSTLNFVSINFKVRSITLGASNGISKRLKARSIFMRFDGYLASNFAMILEDICASGIPSRNIANS